MERFKELLVDAFTSILNVFRSTKEAYEGANRFARIRLWILCVFLLDVVVTVGVVSSVGGRAINVKAWFEQGFPSNMLVVRNEEGSSLHNVTLTLDGRYRLMVKKLKPGVQGFEVNRQFVDGQEITPSDDYRPQQLQIKTEVDSMEIVVGKRPQ